MGMWCARVALLFFFMHFKSVKPFEITLLHTNDVHARIEETGEDSGKCETHSACYAGVARRFTKITEIRRQERNVLLLDAGDQFQGTVWFNYYRGEEAAHFMNMLGYDAMALGNHEFDNKVQGLIPFLEKVNFTVLSANIKVGGTHAKAQHFSHLYKPYKTFAFGPEKVAVIGYTSAETSRLSFPGPHLTFEKEIKALQVQVDELITQGYNKIIAVGHSGFNVDKDIARQVRGIDLVIGGHTNTFLYTGTHPSSEVPEGPYPFIVKSDDGKDVPVVQAFAFGKYLGNLKVIFDEYGNVKKATGNPILLNSSIAEDPAVLADVKHWKKALVQNYSSFLGRTLVYLNGSFKECRFRECNLGNLICDAMIHQNINNADELRWKNVTLCILNSGAIRTGINERNSHGNITMEDVLSVLPFGATIDRIKLKGSTLKKAFEHSVHRYGNNSGEFLQVSGIQVEYDVLRPVGERVTDLRLLCPKSRVPRYVPLDPDEEYKLVLPSYIANGGDTFTMIEKEKLIHKIGNLDSVIFSEYIKERKTVYPAVEGRIRFRNSAVVAGPNCLVLVLLCHLLCL
ncbi:hypothetical protein DPEC_G00316980 [Dallia pectoralis]|uniref:Uncharacterized protein n=1 Tax=Dallia pectoralis TaxID=75939 RepID=A0ACC2FCX1_DALPE|nr:hypothetical protein DPEC_G00316980 [Dallia pectoralis]